MLLDFRQWLVPIRGKGQKIKCTLARGERFAILQLRTGKRQVYGSGPPFKGLDARFLR